LPQTPPTTNDQPLDNLGASFRARLGVPMNDDGPMGVVATLIHPDGRPVTRLDDPAGGTFDAAGNFDRLLGQPDAHLAVLGRVDIYGVTTLEEADMDGLIDDIDRLIASGTLEPVESRGLQRLRLMAEACGRGGNLQVVFTGD
jgi:hypothetical protein